MVYTLMTFSHVVLRSVELLGIVPDRQKFEDYIYAWNVAGRLLGVRPELLPANRVEAELVSSGSKPLMRERFLRLRP